jgi:hypothetical protein
MIRVPGADDRQQCLDLARGENPGDRLILKDDVVDVAARRRTDATRLVPDRYNPVTMKVRPFSSDR